MMYGGEWMGEGGRMFEPVCMGSCRDRAVLVKGTDQYQLLFTVFAIWTDRQTRK